MELYLGGGEAGVKAFDTLYRRYAPKVYGFLRKQLRDSALADEVFQQTMLRFHETRERYDVKYPLGPWIFTLCRNTLRDHQRRQLRRREQELPDDLVGSTEPAITEAPEVPLSTLNKTQRAAVEMRYLHEKDFNEIAASLQISETNARQLISRAVRRLRGLMEGKKK